MAGSFLNELERKGSIFCFHITKGFGCPLGPPAWSIGSDSVRALSVCQSVSQSVSLLATKGGKTMQNVYSNLYSQAVTHPSTNRSQPCLTSVIGRELVYSRWYGRRHQSRGKILMQKSKNAGQTHVTLGLKLILNPAARGRERVTSAPFNASVVRDHEKWIHHHQFFCWFDNNKFSLSPGK